MTENIPMETPDRLVRAFELAHAETVFGDPACRREYFDDLDFASYDRLAQWIGNVVLQPPRNQRRPVPGFVNMLIMRGDEDPALKVEEQASDDVIYIAPRAAEASLLMAETLTAVQHIEDTQAAATLLRLGSFLTHRRYNGNARGSAIQYSLLTRGYDGSDADKQYYAKLAEGRRGLAELGVDIDVSYLARSFAERYVQAQTSLRGYDGDLPAALDAFRIADLTEQRPDLPPPLAYHASLRLAERHTGLALATAFAMQTDELESYLLYPPNQPVLFNTVGLFTAVGYEEIQRLSQLHDTMKSAFIRSIIDCFQGDTSVYGPRNQLMRRLAQPAGNEV